MDDKRSRHTSYSTPQNSLPRAGATMTALAEKHPTVLADGAVQQSGVDDCRRASQGNDDQRAQLEGEQFTGYRNPTSAHRQQTSAGSSWTGSGGTGTKSTAATWSARSPGNFLSGQKSMIQPSGEQFTKYRDLTHERRQNASDRSYRTREGDSGYKKQKPRVPFNFMCGKCTRVVCAGEDVRVFMEKHHPVLDPTFTERIKVYRHWNPYVVDQALPSLNKPIDITKKISCIDCGSDWGAGLTIDEKYFFFIKIDTLRVECRGALSRYTWWSELPYHMDTITDSELMRHGHVQIPEDSPWPEGWY